MKETYLFCTLTLDVYTKVLKKKKDLLTSLNGIFSVIVLTETWCDKLENSNSSSVLHIRKMHQGGGICIYIHKNLHCVKIFIYLMTSLVNI